MASNGRSIGGWQLVVVVVAIAGAIVGLRSCHRGGAKASKETFRRVQATRQDLRVTKTATGEVKPQNRVEVKPAIPGRIEEILVREGDSVTQGQVLAWMSSTDRAALLDAARAQGPEVLARWEAAYKAAPLMSPLVGTVIVRAVEPGQTVTTSDPVLVVADRLIVKAQVDETDIAAIALGQAASMTLDAYPEQPIPAHVDHIAYEAKTVNNVTIYEVDVLPDEVPDFMRSGMTATVTFTVTDKPGALVVPSEAVHHDDAGASVMTPGKNGRPVRRDVTAGVADGKWVEIVSGLQEGDAVLAPSLQMPRTGPKGKNPFSPFGAPKGGGGSNRQRP